MLKGFDVGKVEAPMGFGINGEVAAVVACMRHQGVAATLVEAMGVSATCFRTHFFSHVDNPGIDVGPNDHPRNPWAPRYDWQSLQHSNYGALESLSYYYGGDIIVAEPKSRGELAKVLEYELEEGRPMVVFGLPGQLRPAIVTGYEVYKSPLRQVLKISSPELPSEVDIESHEGLSLWLVRPGAVASYRPNADVRKAAALLWAKTHGNTRHELIYESKRLYATGQRAIELFADFVETGIAEELAEPSWPETDDPAGDLKSFCGHLCLEWIRARRAAQAFCLEWAFELEMYGRSVSELKGGHAELRTLAEAYQPVIDALSRAAYEFGSLGGNGVHEISDTTMQARAIVALREAYRAEGEMLKCFERVV